MTVIVGCQLLRGNGEEDWKNKVVEGWLGFWEDDRKDLEGVRMVSIWANEIGFQRRTKGKKGILPCEYSSTMYSKKGHINIGLVRKK